MYGLSVRWSLADAPPGTLERLREYVEAESHAKFAGLPGLRFKTWRAREDEWFEGTYVFVSDEVRAEFQADFETRAADAPATAMTGVAPQIEPFEVVAVVRGPAGFRSAARFEG
ncbi:hypothetical protein GL325_08725 [Aeromicrobium sp. 636]|uniref:Monooxygenase n=1 Tax=Aeromicrobium senzhongii TaxID=2663859 RepID=A0A8I0K111_9ACTN|nr:hypothetical protein [Aeromicrobium senzhongii]MBC9226403.1 hypothetical protein [Aeromicrobium senzhongii]MCQ3998508.1 hypothetical protein [Aeromicrobium sp. 636]MTB88930.1 hypothetical protein [Aeromicrobium senzhongii]QNL93788.1 hypothetical protein H9L21_11850 [Aeromicrobium senzhongii]